MPFVRQNLIATPRVVTSMLCRPERSYSFKNHKPYSRQGGVSRSLIVPHGFILKQQKHIRGVSHSVSDRLHMQSLNSSLSSPWLFVDHQQQQYMRHTFARQKARYEMQVCRKMRLKCSSFFFPLQPASAPIGARLCPKNQSISTAKETKTNSGAFVGCT